MQTALRIVFSMAAIEAQGFTISAGSHVDTRAGVATIFSKQYRGRGLDATPAVCYQVRF